MLIFKTSDCFFQDSKNSIPPKFKPSHSKILLICFWENVITLFSLTDFQDFPVLENIKTKFQDFQGFPGPVRTLYK